jgi:hypothetical protein
MPQVIVIPFDGQEIGQGYNSKTRESIGTGLIVANIAEDPAANGQDVTTIFESVTSQESLMESLGISASLDVRYGLFSGGAKFNFAENHSVNSFSSFIVGRCVVHNALHHGHDFRLNETAAQLVTAGRMDEFKTAFGDMFVRAMKTGGEFDVVARITSVSEEHQSELSASLHAAYLGLTAAGSFEASFNKAMKETNNRTEVTVFMSQAGGIGTQASFTGPDATKILDRLSQFPESVHQHPVGYEVELANYDTIPIPVPTEEQREDRRIVLQDCFDQKMGFLKALSDIKFMLGENASLIFENLSPPEELLKIQAQYRTALNALMAHAIRISTGKMDPPQLFVANPFPPPLSFKKKPFSQPLPATIQLPNLVGTDGGDIELVMQGLRGHTVDEVMAGTVFTDQNNQPMRPSMGRAQVEFFDLSMRDELSVRFDPDVGGGAHVVAQFPQAGTLVAKGSEVILQTVLDQPG